MFFCVSDRVMMHQCTGNPPAYTSSVGYPMMSQQPPQPMTSQTGPYSSPTYNPAFAAAAAPPPSAHDGGDAMFPTKM